MRATERFRKQHDGLAQAAADLERRLTPARVVAEAAELRAALQTFGEEISVHSILEDHGIYQPLFQVDDPDVRLAARRLHDDFGVIYAAVSAYVLAWTADDALEEAPDRFIVETQQVLAALRARIAREHAELYPLLDRLG